MQNAKELILFKLDEIADLLAQVKCDGMDLTDADCEDVNEELWGALATLEQTVDYYVD
jgi:hypothetical protein